MFKGFGEKGVFQCFPQFFPFFFQPSKMKKKTTEAEGIENYFPKP